MGSESLTIYQKAQEVIRGFNENGIESDVFDSANWANNGRGLYYLNQKDGRIYSGEAGISRTGFKSDGRPYAIIDVVIVGLRKEEIV